MLNVAKVDAVKQITPSKTLLCLLCVLTESPTVYFSMPSKTKRGHLKELNGLRAYPSYSNLTSSLATIKSSMPNM